MTRAPMSASIIVQYGPDSMRVRSSTVSPARAPPACTFVFIALSLMKYLEFSRRSSLMQASMSRRAGEYRRETPQTFHQSCRVAANPQPQMVFESEVRPGNDQQAVLRPQDFGQIRRWP